MQEKSSERFLRPTSWAWQTEIKVNDSARLRSVYMIMWNQLIIKQIEMNQCDLPRNQNVHEILPVTWHSNNTSK